MRPGRDRRIRNTVHLSLQYEATICERCAALNHFERKSAASLRLARPLVLWMSLVVIQDNWDLASVAAAEEQVF